MSETDRHKELLKEIRLNRDRINEIADKKVGRLELFGWLAVLGGVAGLVLGA